MAGDDGETERTTVRTYVPAYQKAEWEAHATDLDMSQSEFVRTMVQAGRREFSVDPEEPDSSDPDPQGQTVEDRVLDVIRREGPQSWEELLSELTANIEEQLEDALDELQERNEVKYSGRDGGYTLIDR